MFTQLKRHFKQLWHLKEKNSTTFYLSFILFQEGKKNVDSIPLVLASEL